MERLRSLCPKNRVNWRGRSTAVLVYSAQSVDGDAVRDLSGHFNDGRVERF